MRQYGCGCGKKTGTTCPNLLRRQEPLLPTANKSARGFVGEEANGRRSMRATERAAEQPITQRSRGTCRVNRARIVEDWAAVEERVAEDAAFELRHRLCGTWEWEQEQDRALSTSSWHTSMRAQRAACLPSLISPSAASQSTAPSGCRRESRLLASAFSGGERRGAMTLQRSRKARFVVGKGVSASGLQRADETIRSAAPAVVTACVHPPSLPVRLPASKSP